MAATVLFFKLIRATFYVESDSADNIFEGNAVLDIFASQFFFIIRVFYMVGRSPSFWIRWRIAFDIWKKYFLLSVLCKDWWFI